MTAVDILIIVAVIAATVHGFARGFFRQLGFLLGFIAGTLVAGFLLPYLLPLFESGGARAAAVVVVGLGAAFGIGEVGERLGFLVSRALHRVKGGPLDSLAGAFLSGAGALVAIWLIFTLFSGIPLPVVREEIRRSFVLQRLDETLPPAPTVLSRIEEFLHLNGFPDVFIGLEPPLPAPMDEPQTEELRQALENAREAVVRIEGVGCGGIGIGSGFVVEEGLVMTNAHVIAGINRPVVVVDRRRLPASPIVFDPHLDLAVLRVRGLTLPPLPLAETEAERGTLGAVLGYPGGIFTVAPAGVLQRFQAVGRDIYNQGMVVRSVYAVQADVRQGNSGGPLVLPDGRVIGVIFAKSEGEEGVGFAITSVQSREVLERAENSTQAVGTGSCLAL